MIALLIILYITLGLMITLKFFKMAVTLTTLGGFILMVALWPIWFLIYLYCVHLPDFGDDFY